MAPKRHSSMNDPPSASSSEEVADSEGFSDKAYSDYEDDHREQDRRNNHREQDGRNRGGKAESEEEVESEEEEEEEKEEEEEEDEEEEEEEKTSKMPPPVDKRGSVQKPNPTATPRPQSSSSSEDSRGVSDSEADSGKLHSPSASDFTVKPIISKPMNDTIKPRKRSSKPSESKPSAKRPAEADLNVKDSRTKRSKISNVDDEDGAIEEKKSIVNRLWSEDDEIALLKGMIDYKSKKGADPYADMVAFHEFLKKSLHVDVSKNQLTDKIRRLKKKYRTNAEKGENGEDPVFSKQHDHKAFELSKKIWGGATSNGVDDSAKISHKKARMSGKAKTSVAPPKEDAHELALQEASKALKCGTNSNQGDFWSMYPRLHESLNLEKGLPFCGFEKNILLEKMPLIGNAKAHELEERWSNLRVEELEVYLKRVGLIQEQAKLVLAAMKSSQL